MGSLEQDPFSLEDLRILLETFKEEEVAEKVAKLAPIALAQKDVIEAVIKHSPLESRLILRKVNSSFRGEVDRAPLSLESVLIKYGQNSYSLLVFDDSFNVTVRQMVDRMEVEQPGKRLFVSRTMTRDNYMKMELLSFLFNKGTVINRLIIRQNSEGHRYCNIMQVFRACRLETQRQIKVKVLKIEMNVDQYLGQDFDIFDPSTLRRLTLTKYTENGYHGMPIAYDSEQWKNLTKFNCTDNIESRNQITSLSHFAHLNTARFHLGASVTPESIMMLKELLLKNQSFEVIHIYHQLTEAEFNRINAQLGTNNIYGIGDRPFSWAYFPYPNNRDAKLAVCVLYDQLWFRRTIL